MPQHSTALIVGANRGIGLGVVREYLSRGVSVIATARNPDAAAELRALAQANPGRVDIRALDMNDGAQIDAFTATLPEIDVALVNAGVSGPDHRTANKASAAEIGALMFVNAIAPTRLARHLMPKLRAGGVLAFTSSVMGSVALNPGGHELYRASKAALNSLTRGLHPELRGRGVGKALLLHLARLANARGYGRMDWSVLDWNEPAITFYESLGARRHREWQICRLTGAALVQYA